MSARRVTGIEYDAIRILMILQIWWLGVRLYRDPAVAFRATVKMVRRFSELNGRNKLVRAYKLNGTYAWDMFNPAWPSPGFNRFFTTHLREVVPAQGNSQSLRRLLIAITKRCPLQCAHCSEAATLYNADVLQVEDFIARIDPLVGSGVGQLVYSGGEPLSRWDDLLVLLQHYRDRCDQWIYTSAFGLTAEKARLLKAAGLNGAAVSLDHHEEAEHNHFRGSEKSFYWVKEGIKNLQDAGILVSINTCPTRDYVRSNGLLELIKLARDWQVPMVNILEPRAVGNWQDQDVELGLSEMQQLRELSMQFNFDKAYTQWPTVLFPAGYRTAVPCGGGRSYLLLDYDGTLYPCPFCKVRMEHARPQPELCLAG